MLGRRTVAVAGLAAVTAFGGGAALAATHGSSHPAKPPALKAPLVNPVSFIHYGCHHHGTPTPGV